MTDDGFSRLLARAREGDELAWTALYDGLASQLLGYLRGRGAPDPEDQLGETFLQVARDLPTFSGDEAGFRAWVFTIAHRRMLDAARARRRRPARPLAPDQMVLIADALRTADADAASPAPDPVEVLVDRDLLVGLLAQLTDEQREVLLLRYVADLDTATVGAVTGRSPNAVAAITRRALSALRTLIGDGRP